MHFKQKITHFSAFLHFCNAQEAQIMLDLIVLHGEFSLFTVRGNFWYQIYRNRRKKVLCSRLSLITLTISNIKAWGPQVNQDARRVGLVDGLIVIFETNILRV